MIVEREEKLLERLDILELTPAQTEKLQEELLEILIELDRICTKRNIPYYLYAGTLLGAVRHKGFIPWDDDIDVAMFRKDYSEFKKVVQEELDTKRFFFQTQETDENYNWVFGRIRKENTLFMRSGQEHIGYHNGIFIDVFPMDNISENKIKQKFIIYACKFWKKVLWSPVGVKSGKNTLHKVVFRALKLIPREVAISSYNYFAYKLNSDNTSLIIGHSVLSKIFRKSWFEGNMKLEFENVKFSVPKNYHDILTEMYGDYMKLPPKEERRGHHYASYIRFSDGSEIK